MQILFVLYDKLNALLMEMVSSYLNLRALITFLN